MGLSHGLATPCHHALHADMPSHMARPAISNGGYACSMSRVMVHAGMARWSPMHSMVRVHPHKGASALLTRSQKHDGAALHEDKTSHRSRSSGSHSGGLVSSRQQQNGSLTSEGSMPKGQTPMEQHSTAVTTTGAGLSERQPGKKQILLQSMF